MALMSLNKDNRSWTTVHSQHVPVKKSEGGLHDARADLLN